jgi:PKD repeat protein
MIGLKEAAGLLASAVLFVSSVMVPAGDHSVVAVDSVDGTATEAVAAEPVTLDADDLTVFDPVVSAGDSAPPATHEGAVDRVAVRAAPDAGPQSLTFGDQRLDVPAGAALTVENVVGTVDLAPTEEGASLGLDGTATDVRIEPPQAPRVSTEATDGGLPAERVELDGREIAPGYRDAGEWGSVAIPLAADAGDPQLAVGEDAEPLRVNQTVELSNFVGLVAYVQVSSDRAEVRLEGYANVTVGDKRVDERASTGTEVETPDAPSRGPPEANFTYEPEEPSTGEPVQFTDTSSAELAIVHREWDFDDGERSSKPDPEHAFPAPGSYDVKLAIRDANGREDTETKTVHVGNSPPTVEMEWDPLTPEETQTVTFTASVSDRDGNVETIEWDFPDGSDTGANVTRSFEAMGSYNVSVTARDAFGATATDNGTVHVTNAPPEPSFRVEPSTPTAREPARLVSTSEPVGTGQLANWTWSVERLPDALYGEEVEVAFPSSGEVNVELAVEDTNEGRATLVETIEVDPAPPEVQIQRSPPYPNPGETVTFTAQATGDGTPESATWRFPDGTEADGFTVQRTFESGGTYEVEVEVQDSNGLNGTASIDLRVNHRPDVRIEVPGEGTDVAETTALTFEETTATVHVDDPDGNATSIDWTVHQLVVEESDRCTREAPETVTCSWLDDGRHRLQALVDDENGARGVADLDVLVLNRKPTVDPQPPAVVNVGEPAGIPSNADDRDGTVESVRWLLDGTLLDEGHNLTHVFEDGGAKTITVNATDDDGARTTRNITVEVNEPPTVGVDADPRSAVTGEPIGFEASAEDPDGPDGDLTYTWRLGDGTVDSGATVVHAYDEPGSYEANVTVSDADGGATSATVEVDVEPPSLDVRLTADPAEPRAGETVTFTLDYDGNRDVEEVEWRVGDEAVTTQSTTLDRTFDTPTRVFASATLTVEDGAQDQDSLELRVTGDTAHELAIRPELPDGQCPDLDNETVDVRFTNLYTDHTIALEAGSDADAAWTVREPCELRGQLAAGTWSLGDGYLLEGLAAGTTSSAVGEFEDDGRLERRLLLRQVPIVIEELAVAERSNEPLVFDGDESRTTYHDPLEPVEVRGLVTWGEGTPVDTWDLSFAAAYGLPDQLTGAGTTRYADWQDATDGQGTFASLVPAPLLGAGDQVVDQLDPRDASVAYPPGRYTVDVTAQTDARQDDAQVTFAEDPEGILAALDGG